MPFMKETERIRREKVAKANVERAARNRAKKEQQKLVITPVGQRVVDLALLAAEMWCDACEIPLCLRYLEEEKQFGLASKFSIRCFRCLALKEVLSSSIVPDCSGADRSLFAVNRKAALGCIESGVGHEQLNKLFSAINLPAISSTTMKLAEEHLGQSLLNVAQESCVEAITLT